MQIGIMARTFVRQSFEETFDAVISYDIRHIQFNLSCAGLPDLPEAVDQNLIALCDRIRDEMRGRDLTMAAISGTFNMIHPEIQKRQEGLKRLDKLASICSQIGTSVITLCTGTRDPQSMWRRHPDNDSLEAWRDLIRSMKEAIKIAEENRVILAFEPEVSNVVDSAVKGRRLLDEVGSSRLKVVMDGANIFHKGELPRMREILDEAFELLGSDIVLAHAKDLTHDGEAGNEAAGKGLLDYDHYIALLKAVGFDGALILHGLAENQVDECVEFLRSVFSP